MKINMRGVGVALVTPFAASGAVDFAALENLTHRVAEAGADYFVVLGTTKNGMSCNASGRPIRAACPWCSVWEATTRPKS